MWCLWFVGFGELILLVDGYYVVFGLGLGFEVLIHYVGFVVGIVLDGYCVNVV